MGARELSVEGRNCGCVDTVSPWLQSAPSKVGEGRNLHSRDNSSDDELRSGVMSYRVHRQQCSSSVAKPAGETCNLNYNPKNHRQGPELDHSESAIRIALPESKDSTHKASNLTFRSVFELGETIRFYLPRTRRHRSPGGGKHEQVLG